MAPFYPVLCICAALFAADSGAEEARQVIIEVKANHELADWQPIWNYFGYDEPNYTYATNGKKLLSELAAASPVPVYVRTHNLFTSGDGSPSLKWGSTNVYREDAEGRAVYDWRIVDEIFDTYHSLGIRPLVELGFMPQALSTHPTPYRHNFPQGTIFTGWAYPPRDYQKWADLVFHFVVHLRDRYGDDETRSWLWEVWNEPDIDYWKGTREEFFQLYDYAADAVLRALPGAQIGGPDSTGPATDHAEEFLRAFLEHCAHGSNYATAKTGAPLEFISFHPKGRPEIRDGKLVMGSQHHLVAVQRGFSVVASFPEWKNTPIILGESDPEGCAACAPQQHPENAYRNGTLYAAYTVALLNQISALAVRDHIHLQGAVTWAFEFEDQPLFIGFRDLATNGIDKPILNAFRILGLLGGKRVVAQSTSAMSTEDLLRSGVSKHPDVNAIATRKSNQVAVLVWNYVDTDAPRPETAVHLVISGLPSEAGRILCEHFRVDENHSNSYVDWKRAGSPLRLSPDQSEQLERAGQLQLWNSPQWIQAPAGLAEIDFPLPTQSLSLVRISW